ncbi:acyltransferase [Nocardioides sp. 616]|uniref:acyltransferase family protein n=1 Tax=Nocardioides sp. 616 TaxID=2268090 RepID=UPI0013B3CB20|nr:acyltransferase [Nocardioides sp. 616]
MTTDRTRNQKIRTQRALPEMPALDGIRAISVAMVFAVHAFPDAGFPGGLGVDIFFVISGFLITKILLKEIDRHGRIRLSRFYARRALRLYPALIVTVLLFAALFPWTNASPVEAAGGSIIALAYLGNIVTTLTDLGLGYLSHTWSLAMEEQFYLLWPVALLLMVRAKMSRFRIAMITGAFAVASLTGWLLTGDDLPYNPLTKAGGLLAGCVLALVLDRKPWESKLWAWAGVAVFALAFAGDTVGALQFDITPIAIVAVLPVIAHLASGSGVMVNALSLRPLTYAGLISYEIYLMHYPVLWILHGNTSWPNWTSAGVALLITLALSAASHRFVADPVMTWRDRRFQEKASSPPVAIPEGETTRLG